MIRLDNFGNELSGKGVVRTDSGDILDVRAIELMTRVKLLKTYFPSRVLVATEDVPALETPIEQGDTYIKLDQGNLRLCDLIATPLSCEDLGIKVFQPKDSECVIRN